MAKAGSATSPPSQPGEHTRQGGAREPHWVVCAGRTTRAVDEIAFGTHSCEPYWLQTVGRQYIHGVRPPGDRRYAASFSILGGVTTNTRSFLDGLGFLRRCEPSSRSSTCGSRPRSQLRSRKAAQKVSAPDPTSTVPWTTDTDPSDRSGDRLMAYWGRLEDAAPSFGSRASVPGAGVLPALPPRCWPAGR